MRIAALTSISLYQLKVSGYFGLINLILTLLDQIKDNPSTQQAVICNAGFCAILKITTFIKHFTNSEGSCPETLTAHTAESMGTS
jgi:hypothetical protein